MGYRYTLPNSKSRSFPSLPQALAAAADTMVSEEQIECVVRDTTGRPIAYICFEGIDGVSNICPEPDAKA